MTSSIAPFLTHGQTWTHGRTNTSFTRTWSWHYSLDSLLTYMKKSRKPSTGIRRCMILPEYSEPASLPLPRNGLCPNYHYLYVCGCQREKKKPELLVAMPISTTHSVFGLDIAPSHLLSNGALAWRSWIYCSPSACKHCICEQAGKSFFPVILPDPPKSLQCDAATRRPQRSDSHS